MKISFLFFFLEIHAKKIFDEYGEKICEYLRSIQKLTHEQVTLKCTEDSSSSRNKYTLSCIGQRSALSVIFFQEQLFVDNKT